MQTILFVAPDARYGSATTDLLQLAGGLAGRHDVHVAVLRLGGPALPLLRRTGAAVHPLEHRRLWDLPALLRLRRLLHDLRPDVTHAIGTEALRLLFVTAGGRPRGRLLVSHPFRHGPRGVNLVDRWLVQQADRVVAAGASEAAACARAGLPGSLVTTVPPGVPDDPPRNGVHEPDTSLACVGPVERGRGLADGVWAFDIVRRALPGVTMTVVGEGSYLARLRSFVRNVEMEGLITFTGGVPDVRPYLRRARVVAVPSWDDGGARVALEAMAAGRPVVATRVPALAAVVRDGETGFLVPPHDKVALARRLKQLLDDAGLRRRLGANGRRFVAEHFPPARAVNEFLGLCRRQAA